MLHKKTCAFSMLAGLSVAVLLTLPVQAAVIASVKPVGFIAAAIADGVIPVEILLPDGASEHDYALRPSDIKRLQDADLVVWVGPEMEAFMSKAAASLPVQKNIEMDTLPGVESLLLKGREDEDEEHEGHAHGGAEEHHHHGEYNMHLWMSPEIAKKAAVAIHAKLLEIIPQSKNKLDANLQHFEAQLSSDDAKIVNQLARIKGEGYFVFHDAYTYFEKHYGLTPLGYFTVNPDIQPGAQRLHRIRTQLVEQKVVCVFAEPQFRPAVVESVTRGTKVRLGTLDPLGMNITPGKDSYVTFLSQLSSQYASCLNGE